MAVQISAILNDKLCSNSPIVFRKCRNYMQHVSLENLLKCIIIIVGPIVIVFVIVYLVSCCFNFRPTPEAKTLTTIGRYFFALNKYAREHKAIPTSLDDLDNCTNSKNDGWDRPLHYKIDKKNNIITIISYGKDGIPGGEGDNADISDSYFTRKPDGSLWIGSDGMWIVDARCARWLSASCTKTMSKDKLMKERE
jgi:hypothetical protein